MQPAYDCSSLQELGDNSVIANKDTRLFHEGLTYASICARSFVYQTGKVYE